MLSSLSKVTKFDECARIWRGQSVEQNVGAKESIGSVALTALLEDPDHITQICFPSGKKYTNQEIATLAIRVAISLQKLELPQTEVIGFCAANSDFVAPLVFGALLCGLSISTIEPSFDKAGIAHIYAITKPKLMFCDGEVYPKVKAALEEIDLANTRIYTVSNHIDNVPTCMELMKYCAEENVFKAPDLLYGLNQTAAILCSSGTTGLPKAVTMSHGAILSTSKRLKLKLKSDIWLCFSSLYWYSGLAFLVHGTISNATRIIVNRLFTPDDFFNIVENYKVNLVFATPSQMSIPMTSQRIHDSDLSSIELYLTGGCAVSYSLVNKFKNYAKNAKFLVVYGLSEVCGTVSFQEINENESVGQLGDNIEVKIINDDGKSLSENEVGEICIRTKWPWSGYYNAPEATNKVYDAERWLHSGDIGYFDKEGFLYVIDRKKDILKYNNYHYYPTEIERVIMELPDVLEVCVVGIPDVAFTDLPAAAVVKRMESNLSEEDICAHVANRMQHFEQLRGGVYFFDSLPHTVTGKPLRRILREICQKKRAP